MIITLGRNEPNGKYAVAMTKEGSHTHITIHKQENGCANLSGKDEVARILIDKKYLSLLVEFYNSLNGINKIQ
jgi:hypothetical protein